MKRRLLPILMTLVLVCALPIWAAFVTSGDVTNPLVETAEGTTPARVTTESALRTALENGVSGIVLGEDIDINTALNVTSTLTLDLNGCTLRMTGNTRVFYVYNNATLTIQDSSAAKSGTITGGNAGDGGGVHIGDNSSEGHLVMTGGTITGCATDPYRGAGRGGGVFVFQGSFTMSGTAKITNCTADVTIESENGGHAIGGLCGYAGTHSNPDICLETEGFSTKNYPSVIDNCNVTVNIKANGATHVGGLVGTGLYYYGEETVFKITNCSVKGSIDGAVTPGTVAGRAEGSTIESCTADVTIDENAGTEQVGTTTQMYESADQ